MTIQGVHRSRVPVAVIDGNRLIAELLPAALGQSAGEFRCVASVSRLSDLDVVLRMAPPRVAVVGDEMPDGPRCEAVRRVRLAWPTSRIVFLYADRSSPDWLVDVMGMGAESVVSRAAGMTELLVALEKTADGESSVPEEVLRVLSARLADRRTEGVAVAPDRALTPRQRASVQALLDTGSSERAAVSLGMSAATCRCHLSEARRKLHASNRLDLVGRALRAGVVDAPVRLRPAPARTLSHRERVAMQSVLDCGDTQVAATRLGVRPATVRSHMHASMRKLGAATHIDAFRMALAHGELHVATADG